MLLSGTKWVCGGSVWIYCSSFFKKSRDILVLKVNLGILKQTCQILNDNIRYFRMVCIVAEYRMLYSVIISCSYKLNLVLNYWPTDHENILKGASTSGYSGAICKCLPINAIFFRIELRLCTCNTTTNSRVYTSLIPYQKVANLLNLTLKEYSFGSGNLPRMP